MAWKNQTFLLICWLTLLGGCGYIQGNSSDVSDDVDSDMSNSGTSGTSDLTDKKRVLENFEQSNSATLDYLSILPETSSSSFQIISDQTRTGTGAMSIKLDKGSKLCYRLPESIDISHYTLLSMAVHSARPRGDLSITLTSVSGTHQVPKCCLVPGWNDVQVDLSKSKQWQNFSSEKFTGLELTFLAAGGTVKIIMDDIALSDNRTSITPVPDGLTLYKTGLNYAIHITGNKAPVLLTRHDDTLWRLDGQEDISFAGKGGNVSSRYKYLAKYRIGQLQLLEHNAVRVRIRNSWLFPPWPGEWHLPAVRTIIREYTWYPGGRMVTDVQLNNVCGKPVYQVDICSKTVAWYGKGNSNHFTERNFVGPIATWSCLSQGDGRTIGSWERNFLDPVPVQKIIADGNIFAQGDRDRDGYDESQGCYCIAGMNGHCRFRFTPPKEGMPPPAVRIIGPWTDGAIVNVEGFLVSPVVLLPDHSVIFCMPNTISRPTIVEVSGKN